MSELPASLFELPEDSPLATFAEDETLPSLPLPPLERTLAKYLESVKPLVTQQQYEETQKIVEEFQNGVGKQLHEKLAERAANSRNWLEEYWLKTAYLLNRQALSPFSSFTGAIPKCLLAHNGTNQVHNLSFQMHLVTQFWNLLRKERLPPFVITDKKKKNDMSQFRKLFNCARIPGKDIDHLEARFKTEKEGDCPSHVVVCYNGYMFQLGMLDDDGNVKSPPSIAAILYKIKEICKEPQPSVATLTAANRTSWWKYRAKLLEVSERNAKSMETIQEAILHFVLDDGCPATIDEQATRNFAGYVGDRWYDKSAVQICYGDGSIAGVSEHTPYDGMTGYTLNIFTMAQSWGADKLWKDKMPTDGSNAGEFEEIVLDINDEIKEFIKITKAESEENVALVKPYFPTFENFGKALIIKSQIHPDTFVQMALQLAYMRQHGRPGACYESASTRSFYHGRTETLRSCTEECIQWVNAMLDPKSTVPDKVAKLISAVMKHTKLMKEACRNEGCDRHLLGLQCIAYEEGIPTPALYTDTSYTKSGGGGNFVLSTSLGGYSKTTAIVAPMVTDGYGAFYAIHDESILFGLSSFTNSKESNVETFYENISKSLLDMQDLLLAAVAAEQRGEI